MGDPYPRSRGVALAATFAALISVTSPLSLSIGPVPITLQVFFVYLAAFLLGASYGALSMGIYLLLGALGLPVFAEFHAGAGTLFGATGGYLFGFLVGSFLGGMIARHRSATRSGDTVKLSLSALVCLVVVYLFGVVWLSYIVGGLYNAVVFGLLPFILVDVVKAVVAVPIAVGLRWGALQLPVNRQGGAPAVGQTPA